MTLLQELEEENKKSGLFNDANNVMLSYPIGFPVLDQQLGATYVFKTKDNSVVQIRQLGVQAGTITMFVGPSQSGKSTAADQAAWNIVEPFGEDAIILKADVEKSTNLYRVQTITGIENREELNRRYRVLEEADTWEKIMLQVVKLSEKKESDPGRYMYDTGMVDDNGAPIFHYIPSVLIIDSLMAVTSENEDTTEISGLTSGGREAIYRGKFFRNVLRYTLKYNINVFVINHYDDEMPQIGRSAPKGKELTYIPTGKIIPGGKKVKYYTNAIILFQPSGSKDDVRTVENNGYNGIPVKTLIIKSRTSAGGFVSLQEFVQEGGFDPKLTIMTLAKERGIICGRNPRCYFSCDENVKFDTRCFLPEVAKNPEIIRTLFREAKPVLEEFIPIIDMTDDTNVITGAKTKQEERKLLRELIY